ncbi:MAG: hypothetical protein C3F02_03020 [Parcubacteria group bacterium]|nr:MAG: hypothetical protein C3F02_03020 [Parcubacteria group bacterium]
MLWYSYYQVLPKNHRYSLGIKVDNLLTETIESVATAIFLVPNDKLPYVRRGIQKLDTLKIFLMILWETKSLDDNKYIALSVKIDEVGKMLGGWQGQILKQNSPK